MIVHILQNKHIGIREKYIFEYILGTLGYFYQWINEEEVLQSTATVLCYQPVANADTINRDVIFIPKTVDLDEISRDSVEWQYKKIESIHLPLFGIIKNRHYDISFDLIANVYYHLTRIDEAGIEHPNHIDQEIENFILYKYDKLKQPVVDILLKYFDKILQSVILAENPFIIKKCAYPNGEQLGVAITHDVDIIRAYHPAKKIFLSMLYYLKLKKSPTPQQMKMGNKNIWGFDVILDFYEKTGWKSTFFFMARYIENWHFRYRIKNRKIQDLFKKLKNQGHEISYHPSRYAFEHPTRYKKELNFLKRISKYKISGMRHHYLRCLFPNIWQTVENLGLSYDASLIYRRYSGFRAGTTRPFICFDHKRKQTLDLWEFPTAFFEGTFNDDFEIIRTIIERVLSFNGLLNFIWHTNNFYEGSKEYAIWKKIIDELKKRDIYITTLKKHLTWQQQRNAIKITDVKGKDKNRTINIKMPMETEIFSLQIISTNNSVKVKSLDASRVNEIDNYITITKSSSVEKVELEFTTI